MAYNEERLTKLRSLKELAKRIDRDFARKAELEALRGRVEELTTVGGEPNAIDTIKVNGTVQAIIDKAVDLAVPVKVSDLDNDSGFQTGEQVAAAVASADHLKRKIVESADAIAPAAADADRYIYMVRKAGGAPGDRYDEYMVIDGAVERVGDWSVDLSGYVRKEEGRGLSANDFTDADKARLDSVSEGATKVEAGEANGTIKIDGAVLAVYTEPEDVVHGEFASDEEVAGMLDEVFGAKG
ncbi:hypothetical protein [uncultured Oscillibacter sp.]|uniref:hypothetical protein n=1 Tax=uncultured Oscillibacter sp. TaxID=876091 RepID=UPI0025CDDE66|nr:hypothetical protein [uncultured Oscillibacter sp.]